MPCPFEDFMQLQAYLYIIHNSNYGASNSSGIFSNCDSLCTICRLKYAFVMNSVRIRLEINIH
jgi:hypothetical protein